MVVAKSGVCLQLQSSVWMRSQIFQPSVLRFQSWLRERGVPVFIRKPKGLDIGSACGQLGAAVSA